MSAKYPSRWNLDSFFTKLDGPEYRDFFLDLDNTKTLLLSQSHKLPKLAPNSFDDWSSFLASYENFRVRMWHAWTYVSMLSSINADNETYHKELARISEWAASTEELSLCLERGMGSASQADFDSFLSHPNVSDLAFYLSRARSKALHRMSPELENFQSEMAVNGESAWGQLYTLIVGKLKFEVNVHGKPAEMISFSKKSSLMGDVDPNVRRAALQNSNEAIKAYADVFASTLNALAGGRHTLWQRRKQSGFLVSSLQDSAIAEETVDAMFAAIKSQLPAMRQHLRNKAKALGLTKLGFQDLQAPLPKTHSSVNNLDWDQAVDLTLNAFATYPKLQAYSQKAIESGWIDSEPGDNRAPGGYCTGSQLNKEARIYMTYQGSFGDVQTLAHELGHAFHGYLLNDDRPLRGGYPMTLAETASTFAQTLLVKDVLASEKTAAPLKAQILTEMTNDVISFCMDIMMRYEFEKRFYQKRLDGILSANDLCALMTDVQKEIFGDALDENQLDPYFWASKMHFYFEGTSFYNYPYTFGYLLSRYMVKRRIEEGPSFYQTYETFMKLTAAKTCEDLCKEVLGEDITTQAFWLKALEDCSKDFDLFSKTVTS